MKFNQFPEDVNEFLRKEKIISPGETLEGMFHRVISSIMRAENAYNISPSETKTISDELLELLNEKYFIPQTTTLENAKPVKNKFLSACSAPPIEWKEADIEDLNRKIKEYHINGMGTGFNLDETDDPVKTLRLLNKIANEGYESGEYTRPVGNIALLHYKHPKIIDFIHSKDKLSDVWRFNISVLLDDKFMEAYNNQTVLILDDSREIDPKLILEEIAKASIKTGDPGIIFVDQLNRRNVFKHMYTYNTVAPCGEVGLFPGEVCQFAYLNISRYVEEGRINLEKLISHIPLIVRFLDNAIDYNLAVDNQIINTSILATKRKIGVGVCGWADTLQILRLDYDSEEARELAAKVMSTINYHTKLASIEMAKQRGSILDIFALERMKKVYVNYDQIDQFHVWNIIQDRIEKHGIRHSSTTALPPTGRSSMILGVNQQIEPYFSLTPGKKVGENLILDLIDVIPQTATQLSIDAHLGMTAEFQKFTDQAISKTVNLPVNASIEDIIEVITSSYQHKLAGITIYVDGSRSDQPVKLSD